MVNEVWEESFPQIILAHLDYYHSDHRALLIKMTVGSGYNTAMTLDKLLPSSASDVFSLWWKQFWGLKIPRKILHFAWRGFHEILPTRNGLKKRNIVSNNSCDLCGFGGESNAYAIFWCPFAQEIWKLLDFKFLHEVREVIDFKNVILYASEVVEKDLFEKIIISAWAIWTERNKVTHGQQLGQPQQIVNWIDSYYETVVSARDGAKVSSLTLQRNRNNSEVIPRDPQEEQRHTILMARMDQALYVFAPFEKNRDLTKKEIEWRGSKRVKESENGSQAVGGGGLVRSWPTTWWSKR
ncbi:hypothetical protein F8388_002257 [Cannabis sativa]|uniref:Reverse transcriptase zinc-binding domain-containing protein n=1 Tax=Cannabis sativa TaxID=3483 RepID=A0A7J6FXC3_CANSA|nr:hypothetical protein F8388_002257 [Cannabis sativa]